MAAKITVISLVWLFAFSVVIFHHAQMQYVGLFQKAARGGIRTLRTHVQRDAIVGDDDPRYMPWPRVAKQDFQSSSARLDPAVKVAPTAGFGAAPTALFAAASSAASSNIGYTVALPAADDSAIRLSASDLPDFPSRFKMAGVIIGALVAAVIPGSVLKSSFIYAAAHTQPPAQVATVQMTKTSPAAALNVIEKRAATKLKTQNKAPVTEKNPTLAIPMTKNKGADWESAYPQYSEKFFRQKFVESAFPDVLPSEALKTEAVAGKRVETQGKAAAQAASPPVTVDVGNHEDYLTLPGVHIALA